MDARSHHLDIGPKVAAACAAVTVGIALLSACESGVQVEQNVADAPGPAVATADPSRGADGKPGSSTGSGAIGGKGGRGGDANRSSTGDPTAPSPGPAKDPFIGQCSHDVFAKPAGASSPSVSHSAAVYTGPGPTYTAVSCRAGFKIGEKFYSLSCTAVRPDKVRRKVFATGRYDGVPTEVRYLDGVNPDVLLAIRLPHCDDDQKVALSPWSLVIVGGAETEAALHKAICSVIVKQHPEREAC